MRKDLDELPSVVGLFAKSLRPGSGTNSALPDLELCVNDHRIDPANLAAYQRLCGFDVSTTLPSTYVHVQAFPLAVAVMADRSFPLPLLGLVHVQNRMTQHRPLDAGEALSLQAWAADLRPHRSGRQVDLHTTATAGGQTVWEGISTYLHRQKAPVETGARPPGPVGDPVVPTALWRLPADLGRRYATISGDRNPIHLSALSAKAFGFPRPIAHGMWLHARALSMISTRLPGTYSVEASFKTPALLPSTVAFASRRTDDQWMLAIGSRSGKPHFMAVTSA